MALCSTAVASAGCASATLRTCSARQCVAVAQPRRAFLGAARVENVALRRRGVCLSAMRVRLPWSHPPPTLLGTVVVRAEQKARL